MGFLGDDFLWNWQDEELSYPELCQRLGMGTERSECSAEQEGDVHYSTLDALVGAAVYAEAEAPVEAPHRGFVRRLIDRLRGGAR